MNTPILLIVYNRPELTKKVFEEIKKIEPKQLFVALDAPKNILGDNEKCNAVRKCIQVDWDCDLQLLTQTMNQGGKWGGYKAIDWFFKQVEEGIILEDDDLPDLSFFSFCEEILERYRYEERIGTISGDNFQFKRNNKDSYYFSKYFNGWGWASWKRVWKSFDITMLDWEENRCRIINENFVDDPREQTFWRQTLDRMAEGACDAWDYQFMYHLWKNNMMSIIPSVNLITNIGGGKDSTHVMENHPLVYLKREQMNFPLNHPNKIERNKEFDKNLLRYYL